MDLEMDQSSAYPPLPSTPPGPDLSFMSGTTIENTPPNHTKGLSSQLPTQTFSALSGISAVIDPGLRALGSDETGASRVVGTATTGTNASVLVPFSSFAMDGEGRSIRQKGGVELGEAESGVDNEALKWNGRFLIHPEKEGESGEEILISETQEAAIDSIPPIYMSKEEGKARIAKPEGEDAIDSSPLNIQLHLSSLDQGTLDPSTSGMGIDEGSLPTLKRSIIILPTSSISTSQIEKISATMSRLAEQSVDKTVDEVEEALSEEYSSLTHPEGAGELFAGQIPSILEARQETSTGERFAFDLADISELDIPPPSYVHPAPENEFFRSSALENENSPHREFEVTNPDKEDTIEKTASTSAMLPPPTPISTQTSEGVDEIELPKLKKKDTPLKKPTKRVEIPDSELDDDEVLSSSNWEGVQAVGKTDFRPGEEQSSPLNMSVMASAEVAQDVLCKVLWPHIDSKDALPEVEVTPIAPMEVFAFLKQDSLSTSRVQNAVLESDQPPANNAALGDNTTEKEYSVKNDGVDKPEANATGNTATEKSSDSTVGEIQRAGTGVDGRGIDIYKTGGSGVIQKFGLEVHANAESLSTRESNTLEQLTVAPVSENKHAFPDMETSIADEDLIVTGATKSSQHTVENNDVFPVAEKETLEYSERVCRVEVPDSESDSPESHHDGAELSLPEVEGIEHAKTLEQSVEIPPNDQPYQGFVSMDSIEVRTPDHENMMIEEVPPETSDSIEQIPLSKQPSDIKKISQAAENNNATECKLPTTIEIFELTGVDEIEVPPSSSQSSIQQPSTVVDIPPTAPSSPVLTRKRASTNPEEPVSSPVKGNTPWSVPAPHKKKQKKGSSDDDRVEAKVAAVEKDAMKSKDEILMDELRAIKVASIQARNSSLEAEIARVRAKLEGITANLQHPAAQTVKAHIHLLHQYNDIRDVGQGLIGMIADNRGVRVGELYDEFGVGLHD